MKAFFVCELVTSTKYLSQRKSPGQVVHRNVQMFNDFHRVVSASLKKEENHP